MHNQNIKSTKLVCNYAYNDYFNLIKVYHDDRMIITA